MRVDELKIIHWPDPRLLKVAKRVETFDGNLKALAGRMLELMHQSKGVGLAAPQVGVSLRLFVMNHNAEGSQDTVYVNPELTFGDGEEDGEEGCLSLPGLNVKVTRSKTVRMTARDLDGNPVEQEATGYIARIWQHESDHLNGTVLIDRMGTVAKLANRRLLKELREEYEVAHPPRAKAVAQ